MAGQPSILPRPSPPPLAGRPPPRHPLIRKLEHGANLTAADRVILSRITAQGRAVGPRCDLIREGERPESVLLVTEGIAYRYKALRDGSRQILALLLPGDLGDLNGALLGAMDHGIATSGPCRVVDLCRATVADLGANHPRILQGLHWSALVDLATCREWLLNLGRRPADQQIAHLFCELLVRLQRVGCADANSYDLPLTQTDLADALGLTSVHVNRTLQEMRNRELIVLRRRRLEICDVEALMAVCDFNPNYLHLEPRAPAA